MSFHLLHAGRTTLLSTDRPVIKAADRRHIADATALLATLEAAQAAQQARARDIEQEARARGYAEGHAAGQAAYVAAIAETAAQAARHRQATEEEIATLALAALRQMIGTIGDEAAMAGIARRAVASVAPGGAVLVETSPAMRETVADALAPQADGTAITIAVDPALGDRQCRITDAGGRIIADLDVQLATIAARWSVTDAA